MPRSSFTKNYVSILKYEISLKKIQQSKLNKCFSTFSETRTWLDDLLDTIIDSYQYHGELNLGQ